MGTAGISSNYSNALGSVLNGFLQHSSITTDGLIGYRPQLLPKEGPPTWS